MRILNGIGSIPVKKGATCSDIPVNTDFGCPNEPFFFQNIQLVVDSVSVIRGVVNIYYGNGGRVQYKGGCPDWLCAGAKIEIKEERGSVFIMLMNDATND